MVDVVSTFQFSQTHPCLNQHHELLGAFHSCNEEFQFEFPEISSDE